MTAINLLAYALALVLALAATLILPHAAPLGATSTASAASGQVRDARGFALPVGSYQRIVSLDLVGDEVLAHLAEPGRIRAVSTWVQGPEAWRHDDLPRLAGLSDLEAVLRLEPDLVLVSTHGGEGERIQRLRDAGIVVCDLGPAGGLRELTANLRRVGTLIGAAGRGERLAGQLERRMAAVAARLPTATLRRRALVLTLAGNAVYGGTTGSSYHDIVVAAGLIDAAQGMFAEPWPQLGAEVALAIDPDLIVLRAGDAAKLPRVPGFERLRAVRAGAIIELPVELFDSPGVSMLDAAELLFLKAYP